MFLPGVGGKGGVPAGGQGEGGMFLPGVGGGGGWLGVMGVSSQG